MGAPHFEIAANLSLAAACSNASWLDIMMPNRQNRTVRTTINLPDSALELAKRKAAEGDATLGEVIAEAIYSAYLTRPGAQGGSEVRIRTELPVSTLGGGLRPGVRLESNSELEDVMNGLP
jgi:hypothetical protein